MKNKTSVIRTLCIILTVIIAFSMISCASEKPPVRNVKVLSPYEVYEYKGAGVSQSGSSAPGANLHTVENHEKKDMKEKQITVFGKTHDFLYIFTQKIFARGCGADVYRARDGKNNIFAYYNEKTGKLFKIRQSPEKGELSFTGGLSAESTEKDYVDYARSLILEYTGVDTAGWTYDADTRIVSSSPDIKYTDEESSADFKNKLRDDPEFRAEYTFRFYKTISGIKRGDDVKAVMRNDGTVLEICGEVYDEAFEPFADINIDAEELFNRIDGNYSAPGKEKYHRTRIVAVPAEDGLWAEAEITAVYYDDEDSPQWDNRKYAIKLVEYVDR